MILTRRGVDARFTRIERKKDRKGVITEFSNGSKLVFKREREPPNQQRERKRDQRSEIRDFTFDIEEAVRESFRDSKSSKQKKKMEAQKDKAGEECGRRRRRRRRRNLVDATSKKTEEREIEMKFSLFPKICPLRFLRFAFDGVSGIFPSLCVYSVV